MSTARVERFRAETPVDVLAAFRLAPEDRTQEQQLALDRWLVPRLDAVVEALATGDVQLSEQRPLTEREREVLQAYAEGFTAPEIAERLFLSVHTVKTHAAAIRRRLGARNMTHAAFLVARAGSDEVDDVRPEEGEIRRTISEALESLIRFRLKRWPTDGT